jgi:hypothetical protein
MLQSELSFCNARLRPLDLRVRMAQGEPRVILENLKTGKEVKMTNVDTTELTLDHIAEFAQCLDLISGG